MGLLVTILVTAYLGVYVVGFKKERAALDNPYNPAVKSKREVK